MRDCSPPSLYPSARPQLYNSDCARVSTLSPFRARRTDGRAAVPFISHFVRRRAISWRQAGRQCRQVGKTTSVDRPCHTSRRLTRPAHCSWLADQAALRRIGRQQSLLAVCHPPGTATSSSNITLSRLCSDASL